MRYVDAPAQVSSSIRVQFHAVSAEAVVHVGEDPALAMTTAYGVLGSHLLGGLDENQSRGRYCPPPGKRSKNRLQIARG